MYKLKVTNTDGSQTIINSSVVDISDINLTLGRGASNIIQLDGAGLDICAWLHNFIISMIIVVENGKLILMYGDLLVDEIH